MYELVVTTDYPIKHPSIFLQETNHLSRAEHKGLYILYVVRQDIRNRSADLSLDEQDFGGLCGHCEYVVSKDD